MPLSIINLLLLILLYILARYYCPYCSPLYQIQKRDPEGNLICGNCGDPLIKEQRMRLNQAVALLLSFVFISPLLIWTISFLRNSFDRNLKEQTTSLSIVSLIKM